MLCLPKIGRGDVEVCLPLADHSACAIEAALLAASTEARRQQLAGLLREDASLAVWAVCRAHLEGSPPLRSISAAAKWLDAHLLGSLAEAFNTDRACRSTNPQEIAQAAELAASASILGDEAADQAKRKHAVDPDEARLAGLLYFADDWLQWAAAGRLDDADRARSLPGWHAMLLQAVERGPASTDDLPGCVAAALAAIEEMEHRDELATRRRRSVARWQATDEDAGGRLAVLVAKLSRLNELEHRFAESLECAKLASLKELAYGAAHEINNPLANISVQAQTLLRDETSAQRRRRLAAINSQAFRAHEMLADLMLFARPPRLEAAQVDLVELVDGLIQELADEAECRGTTMLRKAPGTPVFARADAVQLALALRAMCANSLEAIGVGGTIQLEVRRPQSAAAGQWSEILVTDDGPGISPEVYEHLFDPFYSGRDAGRGLGFGLSKCWRIVTEHGGQIAVDSSPGRGASFLIMLPAA